MHPRGALQLLGGGDGSLALGTVEVLVRQKPSQLRKHVLDTPTKVVLKVSLVLFKFIFYYFFWQCRVVCKLLVLGLWI